jgi:hypothetical protein
MAFCAHCGSSLNDEGTFCTGCGRPITSQTGAAAAAAKPVLAKEQTFYDGNNVLVTKSRFVVDAKTYAMSSVTSVEVFSVPVKVKGPTIMAGIGVLFVLAAFPSQAGAAGVVMGLLLVVIGIYWFRQRFINQIHGVALHTASGEVRALKTKKKQFVLDVAAGLNEAIVHRG